MLIIVRAVGSIFVLTLLLGCAQLSADAPSAAETIACSDPRPMLCTMDYTPVCGLRGETWRNYSNACSACSDAEVSGYRPGDCLAGK